MGPAIQRFTFSFDTSLFPDLESVDYTATLSEVLPDSAPSHEMTEAPKPIKGQLLVPTDDVTINDQPRLRMGDNGALFTQGNSFAGFFADDGAGGFDNAAGVFSMLSEIVGGYELTDRDGSITLFDTGGYALSKTDTKGRSTTYSYTTYGDEQLLTSIADPFSTTTFTYAADKLIEASTTNGGWVGLSYTGDLLTSVTGLDPDGPGGLPPAQTSYSYDVNSRLQSKTVNGLTTTYTYDTTGRLASSQDPSGSATLYGSPELAAVTSGDPTGTITDTRGIATSYQRDSFGNLTQTVDANGNVTLLERDADGLPHTITLPDPDGLGAELPAVYKFTYDTRGNLLTETAPDESVQTWVYHPTWNQPVQFTDGNGNTTLYSYHSSYEWLLSETKVIGEVDDGINLETDDLTTVYTYTPIPTGPSDPPPGLMTSITAPDGMVTEFEYNSLGQLTKTIYAVGTADEAFTTSTYCICGGVSSFTDELGNTTTYQRDGLFRVTSITAPDPDGAGPLTATVTQMTYNAMGLLASESVNGRTTSYTHDSSGRVITVTLPDPDGGGPLSAPTYSYTHDSAGNVLTETDPLGNTTTYAYSSGLLSSITLPDPDGPGPLSAPVTSFVYDAAGQITSSTDPLGQTTFFTYDNLGQPLTVTLPDPDGGGPLTAPTSSTVRDAMGYVVAETDFNGNVVTHTYDAAGNRLSTTTPLGTTAYEYDELHRIVAVDAPDLNGGPLDRLLTAITYTVGGQIANVTTPRGTTAYEYNSRNQVSKITQPDPDGAGPLLAPWTTFTYDDAGYLASETNRLGHTTSYSRDNLGRVLVLTDPEDGETVYTYNAFGDLASLTDAVSNTTTWTYDNLHRQTGETWWDGLTPIHQLAYGYDAASRLTSASDPAASYTLGYDLIGRNTAVTHNLAALSFDVVVHHAFDALGRRTALSASIDSTLDLINQYQYDYLNRYTQITQAGQSGGNAVAAKRVDFSYDANFQYQFGSVTRYADLAGTETVAVSSYDYDHAGRLSELLHRDGDAAVLAGYEFAYDAANRITEFLVAGFTAENASYSYDQTSQLTEVDRAGSSNDEAYQFDENGNRIGGGYLVGSNNKILSDGTYNYAHDAEGNRISKTNIATGEAVLYSWDHRNRLTAIVTKNSLGAITHQVQYTYDVFNRRIVKTIDADGAGIGAATSEIYVFDGLRSERGNAGDHILLVFDGNEDLISRHLHGPGVDQILASEAVDSLFAAGDVLWALTDHLGSVRDLVEYDAVNDESTVVNHIVYDGFGQIVDETDPAAAFLFGFTGRERDAESDLQYNRARYYDAALGRWLSQDPIGFAAGDGNLYRYVGNNSPLGIDPSGLHWAEPTQQPEGSIPPRGLPYPVPERLPPPTDGPWIGPYQPVPTWQQRMIQNGHCVVYVIMIDMARPGGGGWRVIDTIGGGVRGTPISIAGGARPPYHPQARPIQPPCGLFGLQPYGYGVPRSSPYGPFGLPRHSFPMVPSHPSVRPGPGWVWKGRPGDPVGSSRGAWYNPATGETLHPDLGHPPPVRPHWDWRDPSGNFWRIYLDGRIELRN